MPIVKKGEKRTREQQTAPEAKRRKSAKAFRQFSSVGYRDDHFHTIFRSIPNEIEELQKLLCKFIGSFLNANGGILCFGARPNGTVYGECINRKEEDHLKLTIDTVMKKFSPLVKTDAYRVSFVPVGGVGVEHARALIEIRVKPGERFEMYEDMNHEVYVRRGEKAYGPVTPHEIKELTLSQLQQKRKAESSLQKKEQTATPKTCSVNLSKKETKENKPVPKTSGDKTPEDKKSDTKRKVDISQKTMNVSTTTARPIDGKKALKQATNAGYKVRRQWWPPSQTSTVCPPPPSAISVHCSHPQPLFRQPPPPRPTAILRPPPPPQYHAPAVYQPPTHYNYHYPIDPPQDCSWYYYENHY